MSGPFFRKDPAKTFRQNVRAMMDAVAAEGEKDVKAQLAAGEGGRAPVTGWGTNTRTRMHVAGRTKSLAGKRWAVTAVVELRMPGSPPRPRAISLRAAMAEIETASHPFRKTKNRIGRTRKTNMSELLKDIA
jgi:hypothetical protein